MECAGCGLTPFDLPDGVNPELIFDRGDDGVMRCQGCQLAGDPVDYDELGVGD